MQEEKVLTQATLCFLIKDGKVSLGRKKRGIGKGRWNGYGGEIENETAIQCAIRELKEEVEVCTNSEFVEKIATVEFHNIKSDGEMFIIRGHVYLIRKWEGEPQETEEISNPTWFDINNLPFDEMMPADKVWVPYVLSGKKIIVKASFGPFQRELLGDVIIQEVDNFM